MSSKREDQLRLGDLQLSALIIAGTGLGAMNIVTTATGRPQSHGKLGIHLAALLHRAGVRTKLLVSWSLLPYAEAILPREECEVFFTQESLEACLPGVVQSIQPDLAFIADAGSEIVKFIDGDTSLVLQSQPGPSLINKVRPLVGPGCTIVAFPSINARSENELERDATELMEQGYADFCVTKERLLVSPTGKSWICEGKLPEVALGVLSKVVHAHYQQRFLWAY